MDVGDRDNLTVEAALLPRGCRELLRPQAEGIGVRTRHTPLVGDALGTFELRGALVTFFVRRRQRAAVVPADAGAEREAAHHLDTAGNSYVHSAAGDQSRSELYRLLRGAALCIHSGRRHGLRKAGDQPRRARDVEALLADLGDTAAD